VAGAAPVLHRLPVNTVSNEVLKEQDADHTVAGHELPVAGCQLPELFRPEDEALATGNWEPATGDYFGRFLNFS
jgi:hypothetical protein